MGPRLLHWSGIKEDPQVPCEVVPEKPKWSQEIHPCQEVLRPALCCHVRLHGEPGLLAQPGGNGATLTLHAGVESEEACWRVTTH